MASKTINALEIQRDYASKKIKSSQTKSIIGCIVTVVGLMGLYVLSELVEGSSLWNITLHFIMGALMGGGSVLIIKHTYIRLINIYKLKKINNEIKMLLRSEQRNAKRFFNNEIVIGQIN